MKGYVFGVKRYLIVALSLLSVTLLVFLGGNFGLYLNKQQLQASVHSHKQEFESVTHQVWFLRNQMRLSKRYGQKYRALTEFGSEYKQSRVQWTDGLFKIQKALALKPFIIQFEPRQALRQKQLSSITVEKDIFYFTRLNLSIGMHSDSDIITLFERISKNITPLYFIEGCHIVARPSYLKSPTFHFEAAGIHAECSLILLEAEPNELTKEPR